jgi:hypothetical protein
MFGGGLVKLSTVGKYIVKMFEELDIGSRKRICLYCCKGEVCRGDDPESNVFFQFISGEPLEDKVVIWLKLGRDEEYVMNPEPPRYDAALFRVVERLGN